MSGNDGLYLGVALLGGAYLLSRSESGVISGGGLGETIREQIESVVTVPELVTVPEVLKETTEKITTFVSDASSLSNDVSNFKMPDFDFSNLFPDFSDMPTTNQIIKESGDAGTIAGANVGGALGAAFLNGFLGLYKGAAVAGAQFVGRDDVNIDNVGSKFSESFDYLKDSTLSTLYTGVPAVAETIAKGVLLGGDAGEAARILSGNSNNSNSGTNKLSTYKAKLKDGSNAIINSNVSVSDFQSAVDRIDSLKASLKTNRSSSGSSSRSSSGTKYDTKLRRTFS